MCIYVMKLALFHSSILSFYGAAYTVDYDGVRLLKCHVSKYMKKCL